MFINFWYPACQSKDLTSLAPKRIKMLGQNFAVFRDSAGKAHCLSNVCTHRGGNLGGGRMKGDCVECPYHGWQFNGEGQCVKIPSIGKDGKIPARTRIDSYPVEEKYGLVFCFLGDLPAAERPPILQIPQWTGRDPDEKWRPNHQELVWNVDYKRSIENSLDPVHNDFVHTTHGTADENAAYEVWNETPWGAGVQRTALSRPLQDEMMRKASGRFDMATANTVTAHHGPNQIITLINPSPVFSIHMFLFETPINPKQTRIFLMSLRNGMTQPEHDDRFSEIMLRNAGQDQNVLEDLQPVMTPRSNAHEVFMGYDVAIARYREFCKQWEARGWRIDSEKVNRVGNQAAFAIPSPARREAKSWAIDAVPLMPPDPSLRVAAE
jgi:phenylpropionate dioxygenase-like ring-hydroxylating dioxygenase large terminal subunit